jgi:hypothetical protein
MFQNGLKGIKQLVIGKENYLFGLGPNKEAGLGLLNSRIDKFCAVPASHKYSSTTNVCFKRNNLTIYNRVGAGTVS